MDSTYLIGKSLKKNKIVLRDNGDSTFTAFVFNNGLYKEKIGRICFISQWIRSMVLVGLGDAMRGVDEITVDEMADRIRHKDGPDVLFT